MTVQFPGFEKRTEDPDIEHTVAPPALMLTGPEAGALALTDVLPPARYGGDPREKVIVWLNFVTVREKLAGANIPLASRAVTLTGNVPLASTRPVSAPLEDPLIPFTGTKT